MRYETDGECIKWGTPFWNKLKNRIVAVVLYFDLYLNNNLFHPSKIRHNIKVYWRLKRLNMNICSILLQFYRAQITNCIDIRNCIYFFFFNSSNRLDSSSKSISSSSSFFSNDVLGTSGKSDGTFGKLEKSSSLLGAVAVDVDVDGGGDIFERGNGFGPLLKFCKDNRIFFLTKNTISYTDNIIKINSNCAYRLHDYWYICEETLGFFKTHHHQQNTFFNIISNVIRLIRYKGQQPQHKNAK